MATIRNFALIIRNSGRSISDDGWATVEPKFIETWRSAVSLLREREITIGQETYTVSIDLTAALRRHERYFATMKYIHKGGGKLLVERIVKVKFPRRRSENPIKVTTRSKKPQSLSVAESAVHDTFLMLNISAPGCCDFYRASLIGEKIEPNVSLSNNHFESALLVNLRDGWPDLHYLKLDSVLTWFNKVRPSGSQLPTNPMERVLFALLHLSKLDMSPMEVVWLFYAFESLLQTKTGENLSSVVKRLCLLLEADVTQSALVKRKMRDLYNIRSAIVHGGFEITHPMHDEGLDKRVQDSFVRMVNATEYGHAFLLSAIQKTIVNGWKFPKFDETIGGEPA
jgi:Apea-like HEPN